MTVLDRHPPRFWLAIILAVLFAHFLILGIPPWQEWLRSQSMISPPPVSLENLNPEQLEKIRSQWKKINRQTVPLLTRPDELPSEATPPQQARVSSDKNRTVEKETRLENAQGMPSAGTDPKIDRYSLDANEAGGKVKDRAQKRIQLSQLGVPIFRPQGKKKWTLSASPGQGQQIEDSSIAIGKANLLNSIENKHYGFFSRVFYAVAPLWRSQVRLVAQSERLSPRDYVTFTDVMLDSDGYVRKVVFLQSSGNASLDEATAFPWRKIGRFPNPPRELIEEDGYIHIAIPYSFTAQR